MRVLLGVKTQQLIRRVFSPSAAVRWRASPSRLLCTSSPGEETPRRPCMLRHLTSKIKATGPITVAEYMREVLTNPVMGYYVRNNMLGPDGDFITSPEISQIFGELLGVWVVSEWMGAGRPKRLQLVELGPGRGSLAADVLRVFNQLRSVLGDASVSLHLVEVSPGLSRLQAQTLTGTCSREAEDEDEPVYRQGETPEGLQVSWYRRLDDVPAGFSVFVAHEFFDALPVHKFQRTDRGWREVMVDIVPDKPDQLRFVVVPSPTLASSTLVQPGERRDHVEVCAEGGVIVQQLARRIAEDGGAALIADYGHDGTKTDTFRGFKGHKLHDALSSPGSADLTADVDFSYLRRMAGGGVACLGPVTQRSFLKNMGIDTRMQILNHQLLLSPSTRKKEGRKERSRKEGKEEGRKMGWKEERKGRKEGRKVLLRSCSDPSTRKQLISSYDVLTNPDQMGDRFHFFSLLPHGRLATPPTPEGLKLDKKKSPAPLPVAGFTELSFS